MAVDVSVAVLTYNQEKTITRTLDSILNQRHTCTFEIIIGDDSSTDDTRKICEEYAAKYPDVIKPIIQSENQYSKGVYYDHSVPEIREADTANPIRQYQQSAIAVPPASGVSH